jgi:hypothetical protein
MRAKPESVVVCEELVSAIDIVLALGFATRD